MRPKFTNELKLIKENLRLKKELDEAKKENLFLKKRRHSLQRKYHNEELNCKDNFANNRESEPNLATSSRDEKFCIAILKSCAIMKLRNSVVLKSLILEVHSGK